MSYELVSTDSYTRRAVRFLRRHPELRAQYQKTLELLELNPFHPALRLHKLKGSLGNLHAVSINFAYRIAILFLVEGKSILPVDVGSHDDVYSR